MELAKSFSTERRNHKKLSCPEHGTFETFESVLLTPSGERSFGFNSCPQCLSIQKEKNAIRAKQEAERKFKERLIARFEQYGIPKRFIKKDFEDYTATNDGQALALQKCKKYADNFDAHVQTGASMIFFGSVGTGKTHLASAIAKQVINSGYTALFTTVRDMIREIRTSWQTNEITEAKAINRFVMPDLLIIDELGVQVDTDNEKLLLMDVIAKRYDNEKPTILISNLALSAKVGASVSSLLGSRLVDRFRELGGERICFNWQSSRGAS